MMLSRRNGLSLAYNLTRDALEVARHEQTKQDLVKASNLLKIVIGHSIVIRGKFSVVEIPGTWLSKMRLAYSLADDARENTDQVQVKRELTEACCYLKNVIATIERTVRSLGGSNQRWAREVFSNDGPYIVRMQFDPREDMVKITKKFRASAALTETSINLTMDELKLLLGDLIVSPPPRLLTEREVNDVYQRDTECDKGA